MSLDTLFIPNVFIVNGKGECYACPREQEEVEETNDYRNVNWDKFEEIFAGVNA